MSFDFSAKDLELLTFPVVHLNGTGKESLKKEYTLAFDKLVEAMDAYYKTTFHQRDFYPIDNDSCSKFHDAQKLRWKINMLYRILADYLQTHLESFQDKENAEYVVKVLKNDLEKYQ